MLREIDRELVNLRREEANACMHYRLYHAATLVAGSGLELLLECLVGDLLRAYVINDEQNYREELESNLIEFKRINGEIERWALGIWIDFYTEYQIPTELHEGLSYSSEHFTDGRLSDANKEYNRCKHDIHEALPETAHKIVDYLNELLDDVGIPSSEHRGKLAWCQTWQDQINYWTVQNRASPETKLLRYLFPLLEVIERLISDKRVAYEHKTRLMLAENYVFSTIDLVKEDKRRPHSLVDDAAVLTLTLHWLLRQPKFDRAMLVDCWRQDTSLEDEIVGLYEFILKNHDKLFPDAPGQIGRHLVWYPISRITDIGPEALWQNYWKEAY